ncbi:MAG: Lrp/AsnC family transcriptional regulator [Candidatus Marinimicrobia bacterium]|jgi:Lrp/AsnC family leucine-responsive transcriptional regulator|nr:Lrp/AsnC family transcriptional regulator [Candidatus Neomarinimicrobiota bacterium]MCK9482883.1 Lrp/AsnC family transcriptional regulator [Candidatus Neomarinimicrobiota bacterium]MCK9558844.1 Lrp/AsnC family transcriptional regulator [Candidatus Neomarinimicrobiota bacterium]MDD5060831.1 Lrp/AsnC family transcriptional regulator [Candidatus Neomarinimicrobiota bacterium]MDD5230569.1 Lrp/AsnC family transcriptional regulator [Candidatus Neomarinimicrobiota bacterium]
MIDSIDVKILDILQKEGRIQRNKIADMVGLTIPAVSERMRKLEKKGIIEGYHAKINSATIGKDVTAFVFVMTSPSNNYDEFVRRCREESDIIECHSITGEGSHLLKVQTDNTVALEKLLSKIQSWPGVLQTRTYIVLSSYKDFSSLRPANGTVKK